MTNLNSISELTEFSTLQTEAKSGVLSKFSKLFKLAGKQEPIQISILTFESNDVG